MENSKKDIQFDSIRIFLNPTKESAPETVAQEVKSALDRLKMFINNGHSTHGLPFSYKEIKKF